MNDAQTQGTRPPSWTPEEDAKFVAILDRLILKEGKTLEDVYPVAAEEIGRPEGGCKYRYTNHIRKSLTGELKEKLVTNSPRANVGKPTVTNTQYDSRSKLITRLQQVDKDLNKIDSEIEKAKKVYEELIARKTELGNDMKRYSEMLVKSAVGEQIELNVGA